MAAQPTGYDVHVMKTITLLGLAGIAFVSLSQPTWAGPRGGGGGGHVGGGGRVGGFAGGGSRAAPAFYGGGFRGAPAFRSSGAYFTGGNVGRLSGAPRVYYGGNHMTAVPSHGFTRSVDQSTRPYAGRVAAANRQPAPVGSIAAAASRATSSRWLKRHCGTSSTRSRWLKHSRTEPGFGSADFDGGKPSVVRQEPRIRAT